MDRTTIRRLVDGIHSALGPDANSITVEEIAVEMLSGMAGNQSHAINSENRRGLVSPEIVTVHVRVDDCSSRLPATVVAHCYDKVRRLTTNVPASCRNYFNAVGLRVPDIQLCVHGADLLLKGFSASDAIDIVSALNSAGIDGSFDRIKLLTLFSGKSGSASYLLPILPDLISSCPDAGFEVEIGSRKTGLRAQDLLDTSAVALRPHALGVAGRRFILSCNSPESKSRFSSIRGDIRIDLSVSVWPHLSHIQSQLPIGACYTDRFKLLGQCGRTLFQEADAELGKLAEYLDHASGIDLTGSIELSLDAPGEGPQPSGIWAGLPIEASASSGADRAAAVLLREGLTSEIGSTHSVVVIADGLPVSNSLRNLRAITAGLTGADVAGYLVGEFSDSVVNGSTKMIDLVQAFESHTIDAPTDSSIPGSVEPVTRQRGWTEAHFSRGGALIPPAD